MYFSDSKGALPCTGKSVWISFGFCFIVSTHLIISHLKTCLHTLKKRFFSLYMILIVILQVGGAVNLIFGIRAAAEYFNDAESRKCKLDFIISAATAKSL